ncbi:hypothetical protein KSD_92850 [Ktedonobacter sp. SOSP1-85]|nr:hypothetical protein KSD_92850 [Ktedonobacter sp. SOSP1-85]
MRPLPWHPPVEPSCAEQTIIERIKRAKLFVFLRYHRHEVFDDAFQEELATLYALGSRGQPPIAPAQLALATILQAYMGSAWAARRGIESGLEHVASGGKLGANVAARRGVTGRTVPLPAP